MALSKALPGVLSLAAGTGIVLLVVAGLCLAGCDSAENAAHPERTATVGSGEQLGRAPAEDVPQVAVEDLSEEMVGQSVQVRGTVTKQCPAIGCWLMVEDGTGEVFVDLNPAGLRLTEKREGERAEVIGRVAKQGGRFRLEAQSVEFDSAQTAAEEDQAQAKSSSAGTR